MNPSLETLRLFEKTPSLDNLRNADHSSVLHPFRTHLGDLGCWPQELHHCCHFLKTRTFLRNQLLAHKADLRFRRVLRLYLVGTELKFLLSNQEETIKSRQCTSIPIRCSWQPSVEHFAWLCKAMGTQAHVHTHLEKKFYILGHNFKRKIKMTSTTMFTSAFFIIAQSGNNFNLRIDIKLDTSQQKQEYIILYQYHR